MNSGESEPEHPSGTGEKRRVAGYARVSTELEEQQTSYQAQSKCKTPHITDDDLRNSFISAVNTLFERRDELLSAFNEIRDVLYNEEEWAAKTRTAYEVLNDKTKKLHTFCEHPEQENFESTYDILHNEVNEAQAAYMRIAEEAAAARYHFHQARHFYNKLSKQNRLITEFDQLLWYALVDHIKVISKDQIVVVFKDGTEI